MKTKKQTKGTLKEYRYERDYEACRAGEYVQKIFDVANYDVRDNFSVHAVRLA